MRKKSTEELIVMGRITPILASLEIRKDIRGYGPLLDFISYAGAYPQVELRDILPLITDKNDFLGLSTIAAQKVPATPEEEDKHMMSAMVRVIETALEGTKEAALKRVGMPKDVIKTILDTDNCSKEVLVEVLGDKYQEYTHEEIVVFYFTKKILKAVIKFGIEEAVERICKWRTPDIKPSNFDEAVSIINDIIAREYQVDLMLKSNEEIEELVNKAMERVKFVW